MALNPAPINPSPLGSRRNRKTGKPKYKQGYFIPQNPKKYVGQTPIAYRSSWEQVFCNWCDLNEKVSKWSTESIVIQYQMSELDGSIKNHRYIPDFYVELISPNDPEKHDRMVIELKPFKDTKPPEPPKRETTKMYENYAYSMKTYKTNLYKWAYAKDWCERRHMKFVIITENDLINRGILKNKSKK